MIDISPRNLLFAAAAGFVVLAFLFRRSARQERKPNLDVGWFAQAEFEMLSALCFFFAFAAAITGAGPMIGAVTEQMAPKAAVFSRSAGACAQVADRGTAGLNEKCGPMREDGFPRIVGQ